ncbi:MAG: hypothetical protein HYR62_05355 [Actinobacteria bacterium]|nr:hypothetical protein [Actinomycetota bacterium]MBI3688468.1 hypothetical protein [Actinomycetota bacterium]
MPNATEAPGTTLPEFTITVPKNWYALDLDPRTRTSTIARLVEDRIGTDDSPQLRQLRRDLTGMLRSYARQAASHGAIYAALMDQVVQGIALSASLVIAVGDAPRGDDGEPILDAALLGRAMVTEDDPAETGEPPEPGAIDTLAGRAARVRRTTNSGFTGTDGTSVATAESQYFVPVPGTDKVLAMTFSTPNLSVRPALDELFDAIARSLEWAWGPERVPE